MRSVTRGGDRWQCEKTDRGKWIVKQRARAEKKSILYLCPFKAYDVPSTFHFHPPSCLLPFLLPFPSYPFPLTYPPFFPLHSSLPFFTSPSFSPLPPPPLSCVPSRLVTLLKLDSRLWFSFRPRLTVLSPKCGANNIFPLSFYAYCCLFLCVFFLALLYVSHYFFLFVFTTTEAQKS